MRAVARLDQSSVICLRWKVERKTASMKGARASPLGACNRRGEVFAARPARPTHTRRRSPFWSIRRCWQTSATGQISHADTILVEVSSVSWTRSAGAQEHGIQERLDLMVRIAALRNSRGDGDRALGAVERQFWREGAWPTVKWMHAMSMSSAPSRTAAILPWPPTP